MPEGEHSEEFRRGWAAAIDAVARWHRSKAKQAKGLSTRTRFPKNLEREAELHERCAEQVTVLSPDDV